jgi:hypothetical protein
VENCVDMLNLIKFEERKKKFNNKIVIKHIIKTVKIVLLTLPEKKF